MSRLPDLTDDEKRTLLMLLLEDIRGAFDLGAGERSHIALELAEYLGYEQVVKRIRDYIDDDSYRDGRHFRADFNNGGYVNPPFKVTRLRSEASEALIDAVESICMYPENLLRDDYYYD